MYFLYFQRFPFLETDPYLHQPFRMEIILESDSKQSRINRLKRTCKSCDLRNLTMNQTQVVKGEIHKYAQNLNEFLEKHATDIYMQYFHGYNLLCMIGQAEILRI